MVTRILVVDDEPRYVRLMEANLISEGYGVIKAYDGQSAVEMVADKQPDLVLLDVMMPGLDGFGACERIREFSSVPIIMVTAKGEEQDRVRGLDVGADDYIVKPFSATEVLARVRAVLRPARPRAGKLRFRDHLDRARYRNGIEHLGRRPFRRPDGACRQQRYPADAQGRRTVPGAQAFQRRRLRRRERIARRPLPTGWRGRHFQLPGASR